jgi:hypothetical protein
MYKYLFVLVSLLGCTEAPSQTQSQNYNAGVTVIREILQSTEPPSAALVDIGNRLVDNASALRAEAVLLIPKISNYNLVAQVYVCMQHQQSPCVPVNIQTGREEDHVITKELLLLRAGHPLSITYDNGRYLIRNEILYDYKRTVN